MPAGHSAGRSCREPYAKSRRWLEAFCARSIARSRA